MIKEIVTFLIDEEQNDCSQLKQFPVLEVIKSLQSAMTSKDDILRAKATNVFRRLLTHPDYQIDSQSTEFLYEFFLQKLIDQNSIDHTTHVLLSLTRRLASYKNFNLVAGKFLELISKDQLLTSTLPREARQNTYRLLMEVAKVQVTHQLIASALKAIRGEKDPRNIVTCFELLEYLLRHDECIKPYLKEVFEFLDCYYPIEFNEKADKRFTMTKKEIVDCLDECLAKKPIVHFTTQMIFEKLDSQYDQAQLTALHTLDLVLKRNLLTGEQLRVVYDQLQQISETYLEEEVVEEMAASMRQILEIALRLAGQEQFAERIISSHLKNIEQIPITQQGLISQRLITGAVRLSIPILGRYVEQFLKVIKLKDLSTLQKRLEILLQIVENYRREGKSIDEELNAAQRKKIYGILMEVIAVNQEAAFVLALKCLMELQQHQRLQDEEIEELLYTRVLEITDTSYKKCIFDYLMVIGVKQKKFYNEVVRSIEERDPDLFVYSLVCSFKVEEGYMQALSSSIRDDIHKRKDLEKSNLRLLRLIAYFNSLIIPLEIRQKKALDMIFFWLDPQFLVEIDDKNLKKIVRQHLEQLYYLTQNDQKVRAYVQCNNLRGLLGQDDRIIYFQMNLIQKDMVRVELKDYLRQMVYQQREPGTERARKNFYKLSRNLMQDVDIQEFGKMSQVTTQMTRQFDQNDLNEYELWKIFLNIAINQGSKQGFQLLQNSLEFLKKAPSELKKVIKFSKNSKKEYRSEYDEALYEMLNSTEEELINRLLLNNISVSTILAKGRAACSGLLKFLSKNLPFRVEYVDQRAEFELMMQICENHYKGVTVPYLLKLLTAVHDLQLLAEIISQIGARSEEAKYDASLFQETMGQLKIFLGNRKRIVRVAAQNAINEWYLLK